MDRLAYLTMSGAKAALQRQDLLANNLANASTNGFRAELTAFRAVPVQGDGASTRVYTLETTLGFSSAAGPVTDTGRNFDVAMKGNAWLAVQSLEGTEAYTRAGSLDVNSEGLLVTRSGLPVVGDGGPINLPQGAEVMIGADGSINATVGNGRPQLVGRIKMVTPEEPMRRGVDGLFRAGDELPADPNARLQDKALEGSNVSAVETMVAMISAARQFEQQMKMLQSVKEQDQSAAKLLSNQS